MVRALVLLSLAHLVACGGSTEETAPFAMTRPMLAVVAGEERLVLRHQDLLLVCQAEASDGWPDCSAKQITPDLAIRDLGVTGIVALQRLRDGNLLVGDSTMRLEIVPSGGGARRPVATGIIEPRVLDDGVRAIGIRVAGSQRTLVRVDIASGAVTELLRDDTLVVAFPVPGRDEILLVRRGGGMASLWLRDAAGALRQVTNRAGGTKGVTPAPSWDPVWLPGRMIVFSAGVAGDESLWRVKVDTGATKRVGRGNYPTLVPDGRVLVVLGDKPEPRVVALAPEVLQ